MINTFMFSVFGRLSKAAELAIYSMKDAFLVLDGELHYVKANTAFFEIFQTASGIKKGMAIDGINEWPNELRNLNLLPEQNANIEFTLKNGRQIRYFRASVSRIATQKNSVIGWVVLIQDISEMVSLMNTLESMAYIDSLTGIFNRRHFIEVAEREFKKSWKNNQPCSVMIFDLDHFKKVNDTYGHLAGDEVLKSVAATIRKLLRPSDLLARYGGEEFIVFAEVGEREAVCLATRIKDEVSNKIYSFGDVSIRCTISCGVAVRSGDSRSLKAAMRNADIALYRAKSNGRNRIEVYNDNELESKIIRAVENGFKGFQLYYQPVFSNHSSFCIGAESLLRWQSPQGKTIMPDLLIPALEKLGLMGKVERWVLKTACLQCKKWIELFKNPLFYIHINLSQELLTGGSLHDEVTKAIELSGILPENIVLEFKEISASSKYCEGNVSLRKLSQKGIHIAIDRFGDVNSSLNVFKNLFVDELRMDKSFVSDIEDDSTSRELLAGMIRMGKDMNHKICVLGVETDWQKKFLHEQDVDKLQGYLLGEPVCCSEFQEKYMGNAEASVLTHSVIRDMNEMPGKYGKIPGMLSGGVP